MAPLTMALLTRYYLRRLVMAGLNVFMLDTDVVFFHDPYTYLKGSELRDYSLFSLSDSSVDSAKANGGVWYLQNVVPHGPIAQQLLAAFEVTSCACTLHSAPSASHPTRSTLPTRSARCASSTAVAPGSTSCLLYATPTSSPADLPTGCSTTSG